MKTTGFNAKQTITRLVLPESWRGVAFPPSEVNLQQLQERLTALCADPASTTLNDLQHAREVIEAMMFNYVSYDPDTHSYKFFQPPLPSPDTVESALGAVLSDRGLGWHNAIYTLRNSDTINWEDIKAELDACFDEGDLVGGAVIALMDGVVAAVLDAAGKMECETIDPDTTSGDIAEYLTRAALAVTGLLYSRTEG